MFHICKSLSGMPSRRRDVPNMAKLLYGKRKNAIHKTSAAKPSVVEMLLQVPIAELHGAARRAAAVNELNESALTEFLRKCRALNRFDRSEMIVEVADEVKIRLKTSHYCTLMAHANDNKDSKSSLRYWERACREGKVNEKLHGALLVAYRSSGMWKDAVRHYGAMMDDKMGSDPYALHTVMNACRRAGASDVALTIFSRAVHGDTTPNSAVYLELLRCIQQSRAPNRWEISLSVLHSLDGTVDVTAGLCNATMSTMTGALWTKGIEVYQSMKEKNVQPSKETLATLVGLNPGSTSHVIQCITEAHLLGMPITDKMYRAVLTNLTRLNLDHEAVRFVKREFSRSLQDPSNPVNSSLALSLAILDMLLGHSRPKDAMLLLEVFESNLGHIIDVATRGLGTIGLSSQRWIVQGRVGVLDHNVVLSPRFESLLSHYDSLLIPFSSVRLLVYRVREEIGTVKGRYTKHMLKRLQELLRQQPAVRVLPLAHQLNAHTYIVDGPVTPESVELLRRAAQETGQTTTSTVTPMVIRRRDVTPLVAGPAECPALRTAAHVVAPIGATQLQEEKPTLLKCADRITAPERVLAVAAMLKLLNPDSSVHVLSPNALQLQVVERWNALRPNAPLTAVCYPNEVTLKAPGEYEQHSLQPADITTKALPHKEPKSRHSTSSRAIHKRLFLPC